MADSPDRIALPIRVHDFLLMLAGRIDDDALTDARELLAMAELDRSVELVTASLVAGRIRLNADERDELLDLVAAVRSAPSLVDRVLVDDTMPLPRHRFTTGAMDDPSPETGVLEAVGRVIEVLPDIRSLSCVWRVTPAGAPAGPVPQRLVLVETGPDGFAPSTAYRVEQALRRAGIRASVEVVQAGTEMSDYHGDALAVARRMSLRAGRSHEPQDGDSSLFADPPSPRPVTTTRRRSAGAHAEKRPLTDHSAVRWQPTRVAAPDEAPAPDAEPEPAPAFPTQQPYDDVGRVMHAEEPEPVPPPMPPMPPVAPPPMPPLVEPEPVLAAAAQPPVPGNDSNSDADLSNRERELLRQLHEELAKREQSEPEALPPPPPGWHQERSGHRPPVAPPPGNAEFNPADFRQPEFNPNEFGGPAWHQTPIEPAEQTAVNGIPPYGSGKTS